MEWGDIAVPRSSPSEVFSREYPRSCNTHSTLKGFRDIRRVVSSSLAAAGWDFMLTLPIVSLLCRPDVNEARFRRTTEEGSSIS